MIHIRRSIIDAVNVLKTGQTTIYHAGDDGDLQRGVSRIYKVLTTGQYAGTTNITINGKTHPLSNECVRDDRTGLMWTRYVPDANIGPDNDGKLLWEDAVSSEDIFEFCTQANSGGLAGHSDWRVPNLNEQQSLYDVSRLPGLPIEFASTGLNQFWTSSSPTSANAYFTDGPNQRAGIGMAKTYNFYCHLVRGGA